MHVKYHSYQSPNQVRFDRIPIGGEFFYDGRKYIKTQSAHLSVCLDSPKGTIVEFFSHTVVTIDPNPIDTPTYQDLLREKELRESRSGDGTTWHIMCMTPYGDLYFANHNSEFVYNTKSPYKVLTWVEVGPSVEDINDGPVCECCEYPNNGDCTDD